MHGKGMHGRGACVAWGACMAGRACVAGGVRGREACISGGACSTGGGGMHATACHTGRNYEIQSMSGRYASYWNAFLL